MPGEERSKQRLERPQRAYKTALDPAGQKWGQGRGVVTSQLQLSRSRLESLGARAQRGLCLDIERRSCFWHGVSHLWWRQERLGVGCVPLRSHHPGNIWPSVRATWAPWMLALQCRWVKQPLLPPDSQRPCLHSPPPPSILVGSFFCTGMAAESGVPQPRCGNL